MGKDNRGITFVELVIVVGIMSLLVGAAGYGLGLINGKPAEECAQKIYYSLDNTRTKSMGKLSTTYTLYIDGSTEMIMMRESIQVVNGGTIEETEVAVGSKDVDVTYKLEGGSEYTLTELTPLVIAFDRTTGAMDSVPSGNPCVEINITKANTDKKITIVPPTGRISFE